MSIWGVVSRAEFEDDVLALHRISPSQHVSLPANPSQFDSVSSWLPAHVEKQLADDFAFIAASERSPSWVSAAVVQPGSQPGSFQVTIAANGGITAPVEETFRRILVSLEKCAACSTCLSRIMAPC